MNIPTLAELETRFWQRVHGGCPFNMGDLRRDMVQSMLMIIQDEVSSLREAIEKNPDVSGGPAKLDFDMPDFDCAQDEIAYWKRYALFQKSQHERFFEEFKKETLARSNDISAKDKMIADLRKEVDHFSSRSPKGIQLLTLYGIPFDHYLQFISSIESQSANSGKEVLEKLAQAECENTALETTREKHHRALEALRVYFNIEKPQLSGDIAEIVIARYETLRGKLDQVKAEFSESIRNIE